MGQTSALFVVDGAEVVVPPASLPLVGRYGGTADPVVVIVSVAVFVEEGIFAVEVCVTVLVVVCTIGVIVIITVVTTVEGEPLDITAVDVVVWVITDTELATQPTWAHMYPGTQHPPPTSAEQDVLPFWQVPTLPLQVEPSGQHPTLPVSGASSTLKHVSPTTQQ